MTVKEAGETSCFFFFLKIAFRDINNAYNEDKGDLIYTGSPWNDVKKRRELEKELMSGKREISKKIGNTKSISKAGERR